MEYDSQLFQDLTKFLSNLGDVELPSEFELARETLLYRIRAALPSANTYIDMQLGKSTKDHTEDNISNDYVPPSTPSFLYRYQPTSEMNKHKPILGPKPWSQPVPLKDPPRKYKNFGKQNNHAVQNDDIQEKQVNEERLVEIYSNLNRIQAEAKAHKFGHLNRIERGIIYDTTSSLSAALVGSHLLLYNPKITAKPSLVIPIKGCSCEPVAIVSRGKKRDVPTFELCCSDNKTYQFISDNPKERQEWIEAIHRSDTTAKVKTFADLTQLPKPAVSPIEVEPISEEFVEYEDIVNPDAQSPRVNSNNIFPSNSGTENVTRSPRLLGRSRSPNLQENGRVNLAVHQAAENIPVTTQINRGLPAPPTSQEFYQPSEQTDGEDLIYNSIDEPQDSDVMIAIDEMIPVDSDKMNLYDDIESLKPAIELLKSQENVRKIEETAPTQLNTVVDKEELYDDIGSATKEAEVTETNKQRLQESPKNKKERKPSEEGWKSPSRISPLTYVTKWLKKNESPQKEGIKKKPMLVPSKPQNKPTPSVKPLLRSETSLIDQESSDQSDYNSPPPPRPVLDQDRNDNGELLYDDIGNRKLSSDSHVSNFGDESVKQNEGKVSPFPSVRKEKPPTAAKTKLKTSSDSEIYQNQPRGKNEEDNLEHYQTPRGDVNAQTKAELEDNDKNRLYDDVDIVNQKRRLIEKAKQKPVVDPPGSVRNPPSNSSGKSSFDKIQKFSMTSPDKSFQGITAQHKFHTVGKKPQPRKLLTFGSNQFVSNDNETYDDCIAVRSLNAKNH